MFTAGRSFLILVVPLLLLCLLVNAAPIELVEFSSSSLEKRAFSGEGTWYTPGLGSCGWENKENEMVAALNSAQMANGGNPNNNPKCGKKLKVTHGGKSVTVKIVDTVSCYNHYCRDWLYKRIRC